MAERTRNLVIAYDPGLVDVADFRQIRARIHALAPDIEVFLISNRAPSPSEVEAAAGRPTLVFSPTRLTGLRPLRGRVYAGRPMHKTVQTEVLAACGIRVPRTALLEPGMRPDPAEWGEFVVLKPASGRVGLGGRGVQLMRTERVRYIAPEDYPRGHPGRRSPMLLQHFVDTGQRPMHYRVATLFGEVLFAYASRLVHERPPLDAPDDVLEAATIASNGGERQRFFFEDEEVFALARRVYEAVPDAPLHGCDVVRDARDGTLHVIEFNPGGLTWHLSSRGEKLDAARAQLGGRDALINQFGAFDVAARVLIERTRVEAE